MPARTFAAVDNVPLWHDVTPRLGAAYDLFGDGKTAIKGSFGTFLFRSYTGIAARYDLMLADTDTRDWFDLNRNDIADPNELGPSTNLAFGLPTVHAAVWTRTSSANARDCTTCRWTTSCGRAWAYRSPTTGAGCMTSGCWTTWPRRSTITPSSRFRPTRERTDDRGYYLNRNKLGVVDQIDTTSNSNTRYYNGVDLNVRGRLRNGAQFYAGSSTGHMIETICDVENPNLAAVLRPESI